MPALELLQAVIIATEGIHSILPVKSHQPSSFGASGGTSVQQLRDPQESEIKIPLN